MQSWQLRASVFSFLAAAVAWAIGRIVEPLDWLPWVALPLSIAGLAVCGVWWIVDYIREKTRKSLPGFGVHMAIQINQGIRGRRRYVFQLGEENRQGAALYLSASERLVFEVRDTSGEPYPIELPLGRRGVPAGERIYLGAEAGRDGQTTLMRIIVDGQIIAERRLQFAIDFGPTQFGNLTMGSNHGGKDHGDFSLNNIAAVPTTLSERDARGMAQEQTQRAQAWAGAAVFGSEGGPTWLSTRRED